VKHNSVKRSIAAPLFLAAAIITTVVLFSGCTCPNCVLDLPDLGTEHSNPPDKEVVRAAIAGIVVDEHGQPVSDVRVTFQRDAAYEKEITWVDLQGAFYLSGYFYRRRTMLRFAHESEEGFADQHRVVLIDTNNINVCRIVMLRTKDSHANVVQFLRGGEIGGGRIAVTIPPGSNARVPDSTLYRDADDDLFESALVNDASLWQEDGRPVEIVPVGILAGVTRAEYNSLADRPAKVRFASRGTTYEGLEFFRPTYSRFRWRSEGSATLNADGDYVGKTTVASDVLVGVRSSGTAELTGTVACNGMPLAGVEVRIGHRHVYTSADGTFRTHVPAGVPYRIVVGKTETGVIHQGLNMLPAVHDEVVVVDVPVQCVATYSFQCVDCQNQPVECLAREQANGVPLRMIAGKGTITRPIPAGVPLEVFAWNVPTTEAGRSSATSVVPAVVRGGHHNVGQIQLCR